MTGSLATRPVTPTPCGCGSGRCPSFGSPATFVVVYLCRYLPYLGWKNALYRRLGARVGRRAAFGLSATIDVFFPELVSVGDDSIIGYNTVILCHEYLRHELRTGPVVIGRDVVVGATCTILPGVVIGDGAVVSAHSLVNKDVPAGAGGGRRARATAPR